VTGHLVYEITSTGTVETAGDTSARPDTINTVTKLSYDARWSGSDLRLTGDVLPSVTAASPGLRAANQATQLPASFDATIDSSTGSVVFAQGVRVSGPTGAECPTSGPTVDQARQLATERPRSFEPGATWQDTLVDRTCLSGVPLVTHAVRVYQVASVPATDPNGAPAVLVTHTSEASMIGGGEHMGRQISLNGKGSGTTEQYFDRTTGVMLSAHTVAALDLDVGQAGRVQRLRQHADWNAKLQEFTAITASP
jgi:hypothetical protein